MLASTPNSTQQDVNVHDLAATGAEQEDYLLQVQERLLGQVPTLTEDKKRQLLELFPEFSPEGFLSFTSMFGSRATFILRPDVREFRGRVYSTEFRDYAAEEDEFSLFESARAVRKSVGHRKRFILNFGMTDEAESDESSDDEHSEQLARDTLLKFMPVALLGWENSIIWGEEDVQIQPKIPLLECIQEKEKFNPEVSVLPVRNPILESSDWLLHWDDEDWLLDPPQLFVHDPTLLLPEPEDQPAPPPPEASLDSIYAIDRYHLSNDDDYIIQKKTESTRDSTQIVLQHAPPALRLVLAFYKTELQARELRHLHRPTLDLTEGIEIKFTKVKALKRKKIKGKENVELLRTPRDITLRDTGNFALLEYSEESPILLSNPGMASFIFNYYRKKDEKDAHTPQQDLGAANILEPDAPGPFWGYGDVEKGETLQVIFNNMIRAPLYQHAPASTDFLLIRHTYKNFSRWYLREIPGIFTVGQIMPALEVAPPTSRIYTEYKRNRIRIAVYRLLKKKQDHTRKGVKFSDVQNQFPHYAEVQLKSRLKEFMEGRGLQSGHWRLKGAATVPSEEEIRKMVTPEQVCMYETMNAALRQLEDLGYAVGGDESKRTTVWNKDEVNLEEEMAPWKLTKNFNLAVGHKLFLKLEGTGDPTGCGEGFSFMRAGPREKFGKFQGGDARYLTADQLASYKREIQDIWQRQLRSLSNPDPPFPPIEQLMAAQEKDRLIRRKEQQAREDGKDTVILDDDDEDDEDMSSLGVPQTRDTAEMGGAPIVGKVLVIRRRLKGMKEWQEEIVRDSNVIAAYLRLKQQLANAGEGSALDKFRRQKLMSEARAIRENQIQEVLRNSREVKCRRCGQIGHIKTNREKCPAWQQEEKAKLVKRRKKANDELEKMTAPKRTKRRHADVDLSEIFDTILLGVTTMHEAKQFMHPLSTKSHAEFYAKVKEPRFLSQIQENNKNLMYKSADDFVNDIRLIHANAVEAHGYDHPITAASSHIKSYVVKEINQRVERLRELEDEIASTNRKKVRPSLSSRKSAGTPLAASSGAAARGSTPFVSSTATTTPTLGSSTSKSAGGTTIASMLMGGGSRPPHVRSPLHHESLSGSGFNYESEEVDVEAF